MVLSLTLLACMGGAELPEPSPQQPSSQLHAVGGGAVLHLVDLLDSAKVFLPSTNRPDDAQLGSFVLSKGWKRATGQAENAWVTSSPVQLPAKRNPSLPGGLTLHAGKESILYRCPPRGITRSWCAMEDQIFLVSKTDPNDWPDPPELRATRVEATASRLDRASAGLNELDYMKYELTVDKETRPGMLLPAPGRVIWPLALPQGAVLDLGAAIGSMQVAEGPRSDGAALVVYVNDTEVYRTALEARRGFTDHRIDLSAWSGQRVDLTLETLSAGSPDWDYVFLGEPTVWGRSDKPQRRVIVVGIDTTRWSNFTQNGYERDTTVALDKFAESSALFDQAWAPAPRTRPSFRSATTGFYPLDAMSSPTVAEVLRPLGFATGGVTANVHLVPRFGFNDGFDYWIYENSVSAAEEIQRARAWLSRNQDRDSFLFMHIMDPHSWYNAPLTYRNKYVTTDPGPLSAEMNRWMVLNQSSRLTEENKQWLQARYDAELSYATDQLAEFFAWVCSLPGETLVIFHSDHGEEFWDHGSYEHNHTLYTELVHAILWIRPPSGWGGGPHRIDLPTSLVDIAPTIYDFVGVPADQRPKTDGVSLRPLLDAALAEQRPALEAQLSQRALEIGHLMYDRERWGVVADNKVYIVQTWSGEEELYDLRKDPKQQHNLVSETSRAQLDERLKRLSEATSWPAGPGWRVRISSGSVPFVLRFTHPVDGVIIDPEADNPRRANVEWGEQPRHSAADVGTLTRSLEGDQLSFSPGGWGRGLIAVRTGDWDSGAELVVGSEVVVIPPEGGTFRVGELLLEVDPGAVILPLDNEAAHLKDTEAGDSEAIKTLKLLGYIED